MKFLWLQELGGKTILAQLSDRFAENAIFLSTVQRWLRRFTEGNTSYDDPESLGRPMVVIGDILGKFHPKHPFAFGRIMSRMSA
jgi:hypothetical protein